MKLSDIPLSEIIVGTKVRSVIGSTGKVLSVSEKYPASTSDRIGWIVVEWENGNLSFGPYYDPDYDDYDGTTQRQYFGKIDVL